MDIVKISPENLEVANAYLANGSITDAASQLCISPDRVTEILDKREVRTYIDQVFLDQGYRNRTKLAQALDRIIDSKLEDAEETGLWSKKDLADLLDMAHRHRIAELKLMQAERKENVPTQQTNVQINHKEENPILKGNYGELIQTLLRCPNELND